MANTNPELDMLRGKLAQAKLPVELKEKAERMLARIGSIEQMSGYSMQELEIVSKYIDWICLIPFDNYTLDNLDLGNAQAQLDKNHYGLQAIKESLLEYLASRALLARNSSAATTSNEQATTVTTDQAVSPTTPTQTGPTSAAQPTYKPTPHYYSTIASPILCFVGVQGIGKTTMAKSIAEALGRSFQRISLGAFANVSELRGRSKGEAAAEPGQIVKALVKSRSMNPVILLDEIDKVSDATGLRADVMGTQLEILDPEQNKEFVDRYLDYPIDLSQVIFITTANNLGGISAALLDRLEVVRFSSYTDVEKQYIAKNYLLPKIRVRTGITAEQLDFSDDVWPLVIRPLGFDPGIRQLERNLTQLARKVAKMIVMGQQGKVVISPQNFRQFFPEQISVYS